MRANRYHIPGCIWHITQRCHKREFLLKFGRDRRRWIRWLFEARKRYGLQVLNFAATSNHIHLLAVEGEAETAIPRSMQLIAGRVGQEYNERKGRHGAFWEDRYHATAVESGIHLRRCMRYIDMNMVRARVVPHPAEWESSGWHHIQQPPERYRIIDTESTARHLGMVDGEELAVEQRRWVCKAVDTGTARESEWTQSLAVGSEAFVRSVKTRLGSRGLFKEIVTQSGTSLLREETAPYGALFEGESGTLSALTPLWNAGSLYT
jgi:putative transposase